MVSDFEFDEFKKKKMKRTMMIVMLVGLIVPTVINAQKVYKDGSNRVILDLTVAAGMPKDAVTATKKTWTGTPSNTVGPMANNSAGGTINATVFQKLEIAPHDVNTLKEIKATGTMKMDWVAAFNACKGSSSYGGGWRIPTQRELMLMFIFRPAFDAIFIDSAINGTPFSTGFLYWTATEYDPVYTWIGEFGGGGINLAIKAGAHRVRCVREVTN